MTKIFRSWPDDANIEMAHSIWGTDPNQVVPIKISGGRCAVAEEVMLDVDSIDGLVDGELGPDPYIVPAEVIIADSGEPLSPLELTERTYTGIDQRDMPTRWYDDDMCDLNAALEDAANHQYFRS